MDKNIFLKYKKSLADSSRIVNSSQSRILQENDFDVQYHSSERANKSLERYEHEQLIERKNHKYQESNYT
jgi:hypothetical protein